MKIKILGGRKEIGGNFVIIEDEGKRLIFDVGFRYSIIKKIFDPLFNGWAVFTEGVTETLKNMRIIPPNIFGIFSDDSIIDKQTAIFISHGHLDHFGLLQFIHPDVPVYTSEYTKNILLVYELTSRKPFLVGKTKSENNSAKEGQISFRKLIRNLHTLEYFKQYEILSFRITPLPMDHSVEDTAFLIEKNGKTILYTGDFYISSLTKKSLEFLKNKKIDITISEGTYLGAKKDSILDKDLKEQLNVVKNNGKPIFVLLYPRFIKRIKEIYKILGNARLPFLTVQNAVTMMVFKETLGSTPIKVISHKRERLSSLHSELYSLYGFTSWKELPSNSIVFLSMLEFYSVYRINREKVEGSYVIHSSSSPFDIYQELILNRVKYIINDLNLKYIHAHKSSHAPPSQLEEFINRIKTSMVVPIHTKQPEKFPHKKIVLESEIEI